MNRLRQTLGLIRTSLGQLTVSQRLLIAALMVVGLMMLLLARVLAEGGRLQAEADAFV